MNISKEDNIIINQSITGLWKINSYLFSLFCIEPEKWEELLNIEKKKLKKKFSIYFSEDDIFNIYIITHIIKNYKGKNRVRYILNKAFKAINENYPEIDEEKIYLLLDIEEQKNKNKDTTFLEQPKLLPNNNLNYPKENKINNPMTNKIKSIILVKREYILCLEDLDLIRLGTTFRLDNDNIMTWKVVIIGPKNTPYYGGIFLLSIVFPDDYPDHGPEIRFKNKIYHLNVVNDKNSSEFGSILINNINEWRKNGKVNGGFYCIKRAIFDIFCSFYEQGVTCAYDKKMAYLYENKRELFNAEAKKWTQMFAHP